MPSGFGLGLLVGAVVFALCGWLIAAFLVTLISALVKVVLLLAVLVFAVAAFKAVFGRNGSGARDRP